MRASRVAVAGWAAAVEMAGCVRLRRGRWGSGRAGVQGARGVGDGGARRCWLRLGPPRRAASRLRAANARAFDCRLASSRTRRRLWRSGPRRDDRDSESANFAPPTIPMATLQQIFVKQQSESSFHSVSGDRVLRYVAPSPDRGGS